MKHSEFWQVLDVVLGSAYGRSLAADLSLARLGNRTADRALADGEAPDQVWAAMCEELGLPDSARWYHRRDPKERNAR